MTRTELKIDNVLCYLFKAKTENTDEAIYDAIFCFYSIDEIVSSKTTLGETLNKDVHNRNNPNKKSKDTRDLMELANQWDSEIRVKFVSDDYKRMPPNGIESLAPMLLHISEEFLKMNEILPKFADTKSEVLNLFDLTRNLQIEIKDLKKALLEKPTCLHTSKTEKVSSFREKPKSTLQSYSKQKNKSTTNPTNQIGNQAATNETPTAVFDQAAGGSSKETPLSHTGDPTFLRQQAKIDFYNAENFNENDNQSVYPHSIDCGPTPTIPNDNRQSYADALNNDHTDTQSNGEDARSEDAEWNTAQRKSFSRRPRKNVGTLESNEDFQASAASMHLDIFISKVGLTVSEVKIQNHIKKYFDINVDMGNLEKLDIRAETHKAYKIKVLKSEREKLLHKDNLKLWPRGVIVDKFFTRFSRAWN